VAARALREAGVAVCSEEDVEGRSGGGREPEPR
jgi:hypothetical protein